MSNNDGKIDITYHTFEVKWCAIDRLIKMCNSEKDYLYILKNLQSFYSKHFAGNSKNLNPQELAHLKAILASCCRNSFIIDVNCYLVNRDTDKTKPENKKGLCLYPNYRYYIEALESKYKLDIEIHTLYKRDEPEKEDVVTFQGYVKNLKGVKIDLLDKKQEAIITKTYYFLHLLDQSGSSFSKIIRDLYFSDENISDKELSEKHLKKKGEYGMYYTNSLWLSLNRYSDLLQMIKKTALRDFVKYRNANVFSESKDDCEKLENISWEAENRNTKYLVEANE